MECLPHISTIKFAVYIYSVKAFAKASDPRLEYCDGWMNDAGLYARYFHGPLKMLWGKRTSSSFSLTGEGELSPFTYAVDDCKEGRKKDTNTFNVNVLLIWLSTWNYRVEMHIHLNEDNIILPQDKKLPIYCTYKALVSRNHNVGKNTLRLLQLTTWRF